MTVSCRYDTSQWTSSRTQVCNRVELCCCRWCCVVWRKRKKAAGFRGREKQDQARPQLPTPAQHGPAPADRRQLIGNPKSGKSCLKTGHALIGLMRSYRSLKWVRGAFAHASFGLGSLPCPAIPAPPNTKALEPRQVNKPVTNHPRTGHPLSLNPWFLGKKNHPTT
jgi:hypothetical protein